MYHWNLPVLRTFIIVLSASSHPKSSKCVQYQSLIPLYGLLQLRNCHGFVVAVGSGDSRYRGVNW